MSNLLIVGSEGKMGKWFFEYFYNYNKIIKDDKKLSINKIHLFDIKKSSYKQIKEEEEEKVVISNSLLNSIKVSDIILFCTPVNETKKMINMYKFNFNLKSTILEISSIKNPIYDDLVRISKLVDIDIFCIHPMFGPGAALFDKNKIIFIPINKKDSFIYSKLNDLFPFCKKIMLENPDKHDYVISVTISLIYFINLVFSRLLIDIDKNGDLEIKDSENTLSFLKEISGSTFKVQSILSESILTDDISLFMALFFSSDQTLNVLNKYQNILNNVLAIISKKDKGSLKELIKDTQQSIKNYADLDKSYTLLYKFLNL